MNRRSFVARSLSALGSGILSPSLGLTAFSQRVKEGDAAQPAGTPGARVFPKGFFWGAATSAYQVEGGWNADGKGESIWDHFTHTPSMILAAGTGDVACDTYHRYAEDVRLMKTLNLKSYRFSVSWPRVQPLGRGAINPKGLDYYSRLTDALLEAGIRPVCTLFHWDLPQALVSSGAWTSRETASLLADYAGVVAKHLGDRIQNWAVFNEPAVFARYAYGMPSDAPVKTDFSLSLRAQHIVNLALGMAFRAIKSSSPKAKVGTVVSTEPGYPETSSAEDKAAAERFHCWTNRWFLEPALRGHYPDAFVTGVPLEAMGFKAGDEVTARAPLDWIGINYYNRTIVAATAVAAHATGNAALGFKQHRGMDGPITGKGWEVWPQGLYEIVTRLSRDFDRPVIEITENGCGYDDGPDASGRIPDRQRTDYYRAHLAELARAIADGADVRGYHAWSLLDNFEWASGFTARFGLVYVDFRDQRRIVKDSGHWYGRVAAANQIVA